MIRGSCLCQGYLYEIKGDLFDMTHCHCSMCRKAHGAPFATYVGAKVTDFNLIKGHELVVKYESSPNFSRQFCKICGSNLPVTDGKNFWIPAGTLDDDPKIKPSAHIFFKSKACWTDITDDLPRFDEYPPR